MRDFAMRVRFTPLFRFPCRRSPAWLAAAAALVLLSGCQTTGTTPSDGGGPAAEGAGASNRVSRSAYTLFFDQGDHLDELIEAGDADAAARLYTEQKMWFVNRWSDHEAEFGEVADVFNARHRDAVEGAAARLAAVSWPAPADDWPAARAAMDAARATLAPYREVELLTRPALRTPEVRALDRRASALEAEMTAGADDAFRGFDHFGARSFFDAYPVPLDRAAVSRRNFAAIEPTLAAASATEIERFAAHYGADDLGSGAWATLGGLYVAARLGAAGGTPSLEDVLGAITAARDAGFEPRAVPGFEIAFVEVTSRTLLKDGQIEFPAEIEVDLPVTVSTTELDGAFDAASAGGADYAVVFDVALAKARRRVKEIEQVPSTVVVGIDKELNPEWEIAQMEVAQAQAEYSGAQFKSSLGSMNPYSSPGAGLITGFSNAIKVIMTKDKLDEAMQKLRETPRYIEKPVYKAYSVDHAKMTARKAMTVHYHVIDRRNRTHFKSTFDVEEREDFVVAYGIHARDPNREALASAADSEADVRAWEEAPSTIALSALVEHYLAHAGEARPLPDAEALRREMLADRNTALALHRDRTFEGTTANDARFDSVVAVYVGRRFGSGFFVRPDVVMTNYHVVEEQTYVEMKMHDGRETFGKVIAKDVALDLALVRVQTRGKPAVFYSERELALGSQVEVIGHPRGHEFSITRGIVSAVRPSKSVNLNQGRDVLHVQIDAATSKGNSGGPVFLDDKVVGVVSWGDSRPGSENLNFIIHYAEARRFLDEALGGGT